MADYLDICEGKYENLLISCKLNEGLAVIDIHADDMLDLLMK